MFCQWVGKTVEREEKPIAGIETLRHPDIILRIFMILDNLETLTVINFERSYYYCHYRNYIWSLHSLSKQPKEVANKLDQHECIIFH